MTDTEMQYEPEQQPESASRVEALEAELAEMKDKALRAMAETENVRRRLEREKEDAVKFAAAKFAQTLLPVADNLRRAIDSVPPELRESMGNLLEGIEATERSLLQAFEKAGIMPIETQGKPFDPNFHEVMVEIDYPDKPAGTIIQQFETGYMIAERLLRPARVGVAKSIQPRDRIDTSA
jgi:molecular chaperone GrpE